MTSKLNSLSIAWLLSGLLHATIVMAGSTDPARDKFMDGVDLFGKEDYPGALMAFEESYKLRPKASVLYNIGMCQKALYRYSESIATFREYLSNGKKIKRDRRKEVEAAISEMEGLVGGLKLTDVPDGAVVMINGDKVGKTPFEKPIPLDPGRHTVKVTKDGFEPLEIDVTSASGAEVVVRAALSKAQATLRVNCQEEKGLVYVNDKAVGNCPFSGKVAPGKIVVAIEAPGKKRFEQEVETEAGSSAIITATLVDDATAGAPSPTAVPAAPSAQYEAPISIRKAYQDLYAKVRDANQSRESRIEAIDHFLKNYVVSNRYSKRVNGWKTALQAGQEPESYYDPGYMRTKKEAIGLRFYGGSYGFGGRFDFATRRWNWFYLEGCLAGGGGVKSEFNERRFWATIGLSIGIPWSIGKANHHEIRTGVGFVVGTMHNYSRDHKYYNESDDIEYDVEDYSVAAMFIIVPEIYYVWHIAKRFALTVGTDIYIGTLTPDQVSLSTSSDDEGVLKHHKLPPQVFNGFIGFRI
ncbi:MAG: PEGA domain-containing protein [Deltaproteobacteria bacterium]|nr:PEGA domain-containing protein [Deltaproteobacteria bacterium]